MKKAFFLLLSMIFYFPCTLFAADFTLCKGPYALCTTALCKPLVGKEGIVSCKCEVKNGYSVGTKACEPTKQTIAGKQIASRYYPIKSYVVCSNNRRWAWCLDSPCFIDKRNPQKASCLCTIVKDQGEYIIVTDKNTSTTCTTGIYSSATVKDANEVTEFLNKQPNLKPFPIKVLGK